jgi:hypothetical protein
MSDYKHVSTPMPSKTKFTKTMNPISPTEQLDMLNVPYATIVSKLMYLVTNIQLDLAYVVSHYIQFMTNPIGLLSNKCSFTWNIRVLGEFSTLQMLNKNSLKVGQMLIKLETLSLVNPPLGMFPHLMGGAISWQNNNYFLIY